MSAGRSNQKEFTVPYHTGYKIFKKEKLLFLSLKIIPFGSAKSEQLNVSLLAVNLKTSHHSFRATSNFILHNYSFFRFLT